MPTPCRVRVPAIAACALATLACTGTKPSGIWLGAQGFGNVHGGEGGFYSEAVEYASYGELPHVDGRSASVELRLDALPFELMVGEEWTRSGVSTDSYLFGLRWYPPSNQEPRGAFVEGVAKFAEDGSGGSSAVDGVEFRLGVAFVLSRRVVFEVMMKLGYFDSSNQEGEEPNVTDGGVALGLRYGL